MALECWLWPYCLFCLHFGIRKMTKVAIKTAWVALFIVLVVLAYGHGYRSGKHAQLTMDAVMQIAKSQFTCRMEMK